MIPHRTHGELVPAYQIFGEDRPSFRITAQCLGHVDPEVLTANLEGFDETFAEYHIGHFLHLQDKEAVLKAVIPFLESLP